MEPPTGTRNRRSDAGRTTSHGRFGMVFWRSLFPFVALALLAGTALWGPWVTLVLTAAWWIAVTRIG